MYVHPSSCLQSNWSPAFVGGCSCRWMHAGYRAPAQKHTYTMQCMLKVARLRLALLWARSASWVRMSKSLRAPDFPRLNKGRATGHVPDVTRDPSLTARCIGGRPLALHTHDNVASTTKVVTNNRTRRELSPPLTRIRFCRHRCAQPYYHTFLPFTLPSPSLMHAWLPRAPPPPPRYAGRPLANTRPRARHAAPPGCRNERGSLALEGHGQ